MTISFKIINELISLFLILGVIFFYLRYTEKRIIFYPTKEIEFTPKESGLDFEDVFFKTEDNLELNGWFIPKKEAKYTILFCHGNAGNISHRLDKIKFFLELGYNVFIFDYRGYGRSQGRPSENGLYQDGEAAYQYLLSQKIPADKIIGYGESLGSAVIIDLAYKKPIGALIIESGFSSGKDMAKKIYPFLPAWLFSSRFDSINKIKSINIPKLIIHSINDEIVPYAFAQKLYLAAANPKEFLSIQGGHNSCFYESEAILSQKIKDFLKQL